MSRIFRKAYWSKQVDRIRAVFNRYTVLLLISIGFLLAVSMFALIDGVVELTSTSDKFCAMCHEMGTAYQSWELSEHGSNINGVRTECVDCHLPPKEEYVHHLAAKAYTGIKDVVMHYFGGEYEVDTMRLKVLEHFPETRCIHCHGNLLAKPASVESRQSHFDALKFPEKSENHCLACHEDAGHNRQSVLFDSLHRKSKINETQIDGNQ